MPPKRGKQPQNQPPSESEDSAGDDMGEGMDMDMRRFMNPNYSREFLATLPGAVRDRVHALQGLDNDYKVIHDEHDKAMRELMRKYEGLARPIFDKRRGIVTGEHEPSKDEVAAGFPADHEGKVSLEEGPNSDSKGLPGFWRSALQHHRIINDLITERDAEALEHVIDIGYASVDAPHHGFVLSFTFSPNEYFANSTLNKTFLVKETEGSWVLEKTEATPIEWKDGKNLTVTTVTKKQKSTKKKGQVKYVTKTEPCESFFNLFAPMKDEEDEEQLFAMAETIKEKIVPHAVQYYTGEAPDGSSDMDDDEDEGDEEDEEEEEESEEEEPAPVHRGGRGGGGGRGHSGHAGGGKRGGGAPAPAGKAAAPECKQQ